MREFKVSVFLWDGVLNSEGENMKWVESREGEAREVEERWVKWGRVPNRRRKE